MSKYHDVNFYFGMVLILMHVLSIALLYILRKYRVKHNIEFGI